MYFRHIPGQHSPDHNYQPRLSVHCTSLLSKHTLTLPVSSTSAVFSKGLLFSFHFSILPYTLRNAAHNTPCQLPYSLLYSVGAHKMPGSGGPVEGQAHRYLNVTSRAGTVSYMTGSLSVLGSSTLFKRKIGASSAI